MPVNLDRAYDIALALSTSLTLITMRKQSSADFVNIQQQQRKSAIGSMIGQVVVTGPATEDDGTNGYA